MSFAPPPHTEGFVTVLATDGFPPSLTPIALPERAALSLAALLAPLHPA